MGRSEGSRRGRSRPRQERSGQTRQRLLDAALEILAAGGPGAVTHRAVAERADVSLGGATYHFASRYGLFEELYRLHLRRVRERAEDLRDLLALREDGSPSPRDRLASGLTSYLEQGVREDRAGSLATFELALERARDPALRRRLRSAAAESDALAARLLRELGSADPESDAELLIAALSGLRLTWLAQGERSAFAERIPALAERLASMLLSVMDTPPRSP
jgi:TetR/AcrR family transcriptional regulator, regulator of biofilm formation and stress response